MPATNPGCVSQPTALGQRGNVVGSLPFAGRRQADQRGNARIIVMRPNRVGADQARSKIVQRSL